MTDSPALRELLDSIEPKCMSGSSPSAASAPCPADAVYLVLFGCISHGRGAHWLALCMSHRNLLHNRLDERSIAGHHYRVITEELLH